MFIGLAMCAGVSMAQPLSIAAIATDSVMTLTVFTVRVSSDVLHRSRLVLVWSGRLSGACSSWRRLLAGGLRSFLEVAPWLICAFPFLLPRQCVPIATPCAILPGLLLFLAVPYEPRCC